MNINSNEMKKKKTIMLIRDRLCVFGGAERVMCTLANELSLYYNIVIVNHYRNKSVYKLNESVKVIYLQDENRSFRKSIFQYTKRLNEIIDDYNVNTAILIGRTSLLIFLAYKIINNNKIKIIFAEQMSLISFTNTNNIRRMIFNFINQICIRFFIDHIVVLTEKTKEQYKKIYNINRNISVIHNFSGCKVLKNIDYDVDSKKIVSVGRIDYSKGYEYLIDVAKKVFVKHPDWKWDIYGGYEDIEYYKKIKQLIETNGLSKNLHLKGNNSNIYNVYNKYAFLVMTSRYEGFGLVLLEAKINKLPLISFDIYSGPSDIIRNGEDGYLIRPFDIEEMVDKICSVIENKELRMYFSNNSYGNLNKFNKNYILKQWFEVIE